MRQLNENTDLVCFKATGLCMSPQIKKGDILLVRLFKSGKNFRKGNVIVYKPKSTNMRFAHWLIGKVYSSTDTKYITENNYLGIAPCEITENEIIGKVVASIRYDKLNSFIIKKFNKWLYLNSRLNKILNAAYSKILK